MPVEAPTPRALKMREIPGGGSRAGARSPEGAGDRWIIATLDFGYIVVLEDRQKSLLLVTAYPIEFKSQREKLAKECKAALAGA